MACVMLFISTPHVLIPPITQRVFPANKEHHPYRSPSQHFQMPPYLPLTSVMLLHINDTNISSTIENESREQCEMNGR